MDSLEALGFALLRRSLDPESIQALDALLLAAYSEAPDDRLHWHRRVLPSLELERVRSAAGQLLGDVEAGLGDVVRVVVPGETPTPPHQDAQYVGTVHPIWTAWVPLHDCPQEMGPIAVWPASHRLGLLPHTESGLAETALRDASWFSADFAIGDVLLFSSLTVHKALENHSSRCRRSIDLRYRLKREGHVLIA